MEGKASRKVEDGKLVRVSAVFDDVFYDVDITGDFFLQPPEALEQIEKRLEGVSTDASKDEIVERVKTVDAKLIGFSEEDIAECMREMVE